MVLGLLELVAAAAVVGWLYLLDPSIPERIVVGPGPIPSLFGVLMYLPLGFIASGLFDLLAAGLPSRATVPLMLSASFFGVGFVQAYLAWLPGNPRLDGLEAFGSWLFLVGLMRFLAWRFAQRVRGPT